MVVLCRQCSQMHEGQQLVSVGSKDFPVPPKAENGRMRKHRFTREWDAGTFAKWIEQKKDNEW